MSKKPPLNPPPFEPAVVRQVAKRATNSATDADWDVVYENLDGELFTRDYVEFNDGRFVKIEDSSFLPVLTPEIKRLLDERIELVKDVLEQMEHAASYAKLDGCTQVTIGAIEEIGSIMLRSIGATQYIVENGGKISLIFDERTISLARKDVSAKKKTATSS